MSSSGRWQCVPSKSSVAFTAAQKSDCTKAVTPPGVNSWVKKANLRGKRSHTYSRTEAASFRSNNSWGGVSVLTFHLTQRERRSRCPMTSEGESNRKSLMPSCYGSGSKITRSKDGYQGSMFLQETVCLFISAKGNITSESLCETWGSWIKTPIPLCKRLFYTTTLIWTTPSSNFINTL